MILFQYAPLYFCLALISGILTGFYLRPDPDFCAWAMLTCLAVLFLGNYLSKRSYRFQPLVATAIYLFMFFLGICLVGRDLPGARPSHYLNHLQEGDCLELELKRVLKGYGPWERYEAEVIRVGELPVTGRLILALSRSGLSGSGLSRPPDPGAVVLTCDPPRDISWSGNPGSFDFKSYAEKKGISQRMFCEEGSFFVDQSRELSLRTQLFEWKRRCTEQLDEMGLDSLNTAILKALILGDRTGMPDHLAEDFRSAGAAHVLALSGLHVGIIIGMLRFVLQPLRRLFFASWVMDLIELIVLWAFALFTGLSASVVRAVGMYSIYLIGKKLSRNLPAGAAIIMALFIMLVFKPLFLFDLGFQLSFAALGGIAMLYPVLRRLWLPRHKAVNYFVQMIYVSTAAQLGVLPLILLYFNQFSAHFLLSSLVLIPLTAVVIPYGIAALLYSFAYPVPWILSYGLDWIMGMMQNYVSWTSSIGAFQWEGIYFDRPLALITYGGLFVFFVLLRYPRRRLFLLFLGMVMVFEIYLVWSRKAHVTSEELFVANLPGSSQVSFRSGNSLTSLGPALKEDAREMKVHESYLNTLPMKPSIQFAEQEAVVCSNGEIIRFVGRDHLVLEDRFKTRIVVLRDSPRIHMGNLIR